MSLENIDNSGLRIDRILDNFLMNYERFNLGKLDEITGIIDTKYYRFVDFHHKKPENFL